jgi:rhomboid family protein
MIREGTCPRCVLPLTGHEHRGTLPLMCPRCRGVFLRGEDLRREFGPTLEALEQGQPVAVPKAQLLLCPKQCTTMRPLLVLGDPSVIIDVCPSCRGTWFDGGEIESVFRASRRRSLRKEAGISPPEPRAVTPTEPVDRAIAEAKREIAEVAASQHADDQGALARSSPGWWLISFLTQLPLEGHNPVYRFPVLTWVLIALSSVVYAVELGHGREIIEGYGLIPRMISEHPGTWPRIVTAMFLHASFIHLAGNMYFLKIFGDNVEDRLGRILFVPFYLACGGAAAFAHVLVNPTSEMPMVGASGAIGGLLGAYLVFFPDARISVAPQLFTLFRQLHLRAIYYLPFWLLLQFFMLWIGAQGVAFGAHIGGFVAGFLIAVVLARIVPDPRAEALAKKLRREEKLGRFTTSRPEG